MKNLFIIIFIFSVFSSMGQYNRPIGTNIKTLPAFAFYYNTNDSTIGMFKGNTYLNNYFWSKQDTLKLKSLATLYRLSKYVALKDTTVNLKGYTSFYKGSLMKLKSDSTTNSGYATRYQVTGLSRLAISLTTSGTSGAATYSNSTGVLNIPNLSVPTVNNATLTLAVSGTGLSGAQSFTANQSTNATFTVTSNATTSNSAGTIVARDGSGYVALTGTFCSSSDSTLKRRIQPLSETDFNNVSKIDFRKFAFKSDQKDHTHFGVMAQQVETLVPEVVQTNEVTGKKEVNYIEMLVLVAAQQKEAITLVAAQQKEAITLQNQLIEKLEKRISELERTTRKKNIWKSQQCKILLP